MTIDQELLEKAQQEFEAELDAYMEEWERSLEAADSKDKPDPARYTREWPGPGWCETEPQRYAGFSETDHPRDPESGEFIGADSKAGKKVIAEAKKAKGKPASYDAIPGKPAAIGHIREKAARLKERAQRTNDPDLLQDAKDYEAIAAKLEAQNDPAWWDERKAWHGDEWLQAGQDLRDEEAATPLKFPGKPPLSLMPKPTGKPPESRDAAIARLSDLYTRDRRGEPAIPSSARFKSYEPPQGANAVGAVQSAVAGLATDRYNPPSLHAVYDAARKAEPSLSVEQFHGILGRLRHENKIALEPNTRAVAQLEHPETVLPLDGELMERVKLPSPSLMPKPRNS